MNATGSAVENALFNAFVKDRRVTEQNMAGNKFSWSRSSRTDKGVHAMRLVLSGKLLFSVAEDEHVDQYPQVLWLAR